MTPSRQAAALGRILDDAPCPSDYDAAMSLARSYLREIGRRGGAKTSAKKAASSRRNGKKAKGKKRVSPN